MRRKRNGIRVLDLQHFQRYFCWGDSKLSLPVMKSVLMTIKTALVFFSFMVVYGITCECSVIVYVYMC